MKLILGCCILSVMFLSGCSGLTNVSPAMLDAAGVNVDHGVQIVADASVLKELAVHKTLQNRDKMIAKAVSEAGFKSTWKSCKKTVYYPGMKRPLLVTEPCLEVTYTPMPEFKQQLPTAPSVHPGYAMTRDIVVEAVRGTIIWKGLDVFGSVLEEGLKHAGDDYSNSTFNQSFNSGQENLNIGDYTLPPEPVVDTELEVTE